MSNGTSGDCTFTDNSAATVVRAYDPPGNESGWSTASATSRNLAYFDPLGDGKTDIAIYRSADGTWWIIPSSGIGPQGQVGAYGVGWGGSGFTPVPGDYDGDRKTDIAIYDSSAGAVISFPPHGCILPSNFIP